MPFFNIFQIYIKIMEMNKNDWVQVTQWYYGGFV